MPRPELFGWPFNRAVRPWEGGTGLTGYAIGDLIVAEAQTQLARLAAVASGQVLKSMGVGTKPVWGTINLDFLSDVSNPGTPTDGYYLRYNSGTGYWEAMTGPTGGTITVVGNVPIGSVISWAGQNSEAVPSGWLLCDGSAVNRTTYADLFTAIGTTYGGGDGSITFNLPDVRGRVLVGSGTGSGLTTRAIGASFGEEEHTLTEAELASHTHVPVVNAARGVMQANPGGASNVGSGSGTLDETDLGATGGDDPHNNVQPSLAMRAIIKAEADEPLTADLPIEITGTNNVTIKGLNTIGAAGQFPRTNALATAWEYGTPAALTRINDTNITITLGGSPASSLFDAVSLTMGWAGQLSVARGGTGLGAVTQGDIIYASAANVLAALAKNTTATRYLSNTGASNAPAWAQVNLANGVTGTLLETNGGTGMSSYIAGDMLYAANSTTLAQLGIGASGRIISSTGSLPTWSTLASLGIVTGALTSGRVPVATGATTLADYSGFAHDGTSLTLDAGAASASALYLRSGPITSELFIDARATDDINAFYRLINGTGTAAQFIPTTIAQSTSTRTALIQIARGDTDTGTSSIFVFDARISPGGSGGQAVAVRPLFEWRNFGTAKMQLDFAGNLGLGVTPACLFHVNQATLGNEVTRFVSTATNDDPQVNLYQNRVATTDATTTTLHTISIASGYSYLIEAHVVARRTGGSAGAANDSAGYVVYATVKDVSGTSTLVGAVGALYTAENQAGWDCTIDVTGATARVRVTGATNNNVTWHLVELKVSPLSS